MTENNQKAKGKTRVQWHYQSSPKHTDQPDVTVDLENRSIWGIYHDTEQNTTQVDARNRAQSVLPWSEQYGEYNVSQSSLSRLVRRMDSRVLDDTPPDRPYNYSREFAAALYGDETSPRFYDHLQQNRHGEKILQLYREAIARFITDLVAIEAIESNFVAPPRWVQDRYPNTDPNLGRKFHADDLHEDDLHDPI